MTWNKYNIITAYCYDPINYKQNNDDTTILPPSLSSQGLNVNSFTFEDKPLRFLEFNENTSLSKNSSILYPQKSFLNGLDYSIFELDSEEDQLKKELSHINQLGIKVFQYSDTGEIYYTALRITQPSPKQRNIISKPLDDKSKSLLHNIRPNSKDHQKLKSKLKKKLTKTLNKICVSKEVKLKALKRFDNINNVTHFNIKKLNQDKLRKYGKFIVIKPRKSKNKMNKKYNIISRTRYKMYSNPKYLDEIKSFNIMDFSNIYRYMVYETRMSLMSDTIHGHIHMNQNRIMQSIEDSATLIECNQKIKSLYEVHKRLSDIPIEYNDQGLPFFLPSNHLSIKLDWTNETFRKTFLNYMKKIYPHTQLHSNSLYISPRPESIINMNNFALLFENLDLILPSPHYTKSRKALANKKSVMAHALVLAKVAYDLWTSSQVCDIQFKPSTLNEKNVEMTYKAYVIPNENPISTNNNNNTGDDVVSAFSSENPENDKQNQNQNKNQNKKNNSNKNNNFIKFIYNEGHRYIDTTSDWYKKQLIKFKKLTSRNQSVFVPIHSLEEIESKREDEDVEQFQDTDSQDDLQGEGRKVAVHSSQTPKKSDLTVIEQDQVQKRHIDRMISLTKPKFISTSLSTYLLPASGSAALLYNHWNKSVDDVIEEYEKLYLPEKNKNRRQSTDENYRRKREEEEEDNSEEEAETYYISDSEDDEEMKFNKHPSNWGYYSRIKNMIQRLEDEKEDEERSVTITSKESIPDNIKSDHKKEKDSSNQHLHSSNQHRLSDYSLFNSQEFSTNYITSSSNGINLLSSPSWNLSFNPILSPEREEKEDNDSLDEDINNINIEDVFQDILSQQEQEQSEVRTTLPSSSSTIQLSSPPPSLFNNEKRKTKKSQIEKEERKAKESRVEEESEREYSLFSSQPTFNSYKLSESQSNDYSLFIDSQSQEFSLFPRNNDSQYSVDHNNILQFNSQPILPIEQEIQNKEESIQSSQPFSSTAPSVSYRQTKLENNIKPERKFISSSQPINSRSDNLKPQLKQTTLASTSTDRGKLLTIKRELPQINQKKKKRRKYGF